MPDQKVVPGTWGKCTCQGCAWNIGDEVWECSYFGQPVRESGFEWMYCPWCGDFCGEGGYVRPNLRRMAEATSRAILRATRLCSMKLPCPDCQPDGREEDDERRD